jgi:hypothetical protein
MRVPSLHLVSRVDRAEPANPVRVLLLLRKVLESSRVDARCCIRQVGNHCLVQPTLNVGSWILEARYSGVR